MADHPPSSLAAGERAEHSPPAARGARPASASAVYDRLAPLYDRVYGRVLEPGRRAMARAAAALAPTSVLEVGVGTGLTLAGYPPGARVVGIDLSPQMLERARRRAAELPGRDITLRLMDAERLDFPDASFDCVTVPYVLSVVPNPRQAIAELRRVCRRDGRILVVNHFSGSRFWWLLERAVRPLAGRVGFHSEFGFEEHILGHDWVVESVQPVNLFGLSRLVQLRNDR